MTGARATGGRWQPAAALSLALLAGCFGGEAPRKGRGSALWISARSAPVEAATLARLEALGLAELFLEAAGLEWRGVEPRLELARMSPAARRLPATLVVTGAWPGAEIDARRVAERLDAEVDHLRLAAEQAGLLPVGVHFELEVAPEALEGFGEVLARLRESLEGRLFLSAGVDRRALGDARLAAVARGVDFLVCFLYGQRPGEAEDAGAWDLQSVEGSVQKLERLARPYLLGAVTVGGMTHRDRAGHAQGATTEGDLRALVEEGRLELKPGFSLEGVDRQVFEFVARSGCRAGPWTLAPGESVRVVKTATPFLEEFLRRTGAWESPNRLGEVFYRQPAANERLSVGAVGLAAALAPDAARPELTLDLERRFRAERLWRVRVRLRNSGSEPTDLAYFDSNYVELRISGGRIGGVDPGSFRRFELLFDGRERGTMRALRQADTVWLFAPMVEGGESFESGDIELILEGGRPSLTLSSSFLLPEGRLLAGEPLEWSFEETP